MTTGPGPDTKLSKHGAITADREKQLAADKVILYGDAATGAHEWGSGKKVLVSGGGATSAWGASRANAAGNDVDWVSRVPEKLKGPLKKADTQVERAEKKLAALANSPEVSTSQRAKAQLALKQAQEHRDRLLRQSIIKNENGQSVDGPFKNSDLARNKDTLDNPDIHRHGKEIKAVSDRVTEGEHAGKVKVTFSDGSSDYYDHIVVGHGQDPHAPGGVHNLLDPVLQQSKVKPIYDEGGEDHKSGNLLGLQTGDSDENGGIRILGAATSAPGFDGMMPTDDVSGFKSGYKQRTEGDAVSAHSQKVGPGIEIWADTFARVNQSETNFPGQKKNTPTSNEP